MLKPVLQLTVGGIVSVLLWKLAVILLLPILGVAAGLLLLVLKGLLLGVVILVVWLVYRAASSRSASAA